MQIYVLPKIIICDIWIDITSSDQQLYEEIIKFYWNTVT